MFLAASIVGTMEEPGEQCTVVFALIVTEPATECVCVWGGGVAFLTENTQSGNGAAFWRTCHHDGKISPGWCG